MNLIINYRDQIPYYVVRRFRHIGVFSVDSVLCDRVVKDAIYQSGYDSGYFVVLTHLNGDKSKFILYQDTSD